MARAAAKQRPPARRHDTGRKHKDSSGQRYEDTLFFNRLRTHAKWVFVLLIVVFAGSFVFLGVGSSGLGLGDLFNGITGSGGNGPSINKSLDATAKNPKDAQAWKNLGTAYEAKLDYASAASAWQQYTQLRPKDADGLNHYTADLTQQLQTQGTEAQNLQLAAQQYQPSTYGPPSTSPLGRALGSLSDPIEQAAGTSSTTAYQNAVVTLQQTAAQLTGAYKKLVKLQPAEPTVRIQLAQAAEAAGDNATAIAAYKAFIKLAPDDPSVPQAKARIKQLAGSSAATQG
jgi:cytochrome c-type biogenesis protein CcmH/NrfG